MARLLSINVGMPRALEWRGKTVYSGIWKEAVQGRRRVSRLNVEGDGQGDAGGHGGEQRAVFVYQIESYRYWEERLGRNGFVPGQFGENFTIEGLPDDEVCIGDRYRIGSALFEVTQPRVTCYRVGIRMEEPRMAALLTASNRPGFYLRVIEEGEVGAGDAIIAAAEGAERMTVAEVNALLYSADHPRDRLQRALRMPALSPGWQGSFRALLQSPDATGNPGLVAPSAQVAAPGFQPLRVCRTVQESASVISLYLQPPDGVRLTVPLAGQFVVLRLDGATEGAPLLRSYSLSGLPSDKQYRVSVKVEQDGAAGNFLQRHVGAGDLLQVSEPRGGFTLLPGSGPVVLLSSGVGATPVLAMLHALAAGASPREVWWLHGARDGASHSFSAEARRLLAALDRGRGHVWYSRPSVRDRQGQDYDVSGRLTIDDVERLGVPRDADFYVCGPAGFLGDVRAGLARWGVAAMRIHIEVFAGGPAFMPGVLSGPPPIPHAPAGVAGTGPLVSFARSGVSVRWDPAYQSLLELAEACDVPVRWSCRSGVCHNCESGMISGSVSYEPDPLSPPAQGNVLICCCRPDEDVVIDI